MSSSSSSVAVKKCVSCKQPVIDGDEDVAYLEVLSSFETALEGRCWSCYEEDDDDDAVVKKCVSCKSHPIANISNLDKDLQETADIQDRCWSCYEEETGHVFDVMKCSVRGCNMASCTDAGVCESCEDKGLVHVCLACNEMCTTDKDGEHADTHLTSTGNMCRGSRVHSEDH